MLEKTKTLLWPACERKKWQDQLDWCRSEAQRISFRVLVDGMFCNCKMAMSLVMETSKDWWQYRTGHFF
jgi:hypothetical protein